MLQSYTATSTVNRDPFCASKDAGLVAIDNMHILAAVRIHFMVERIH
jgi:hypothetical protein